jgi:hypothetical protein
VSASPDGLIAVIDALSAKARKPSPGSEGMKDLASDPRFAAGMPTAPLSSDAAYIGLVLSTPRLESSSMMMMRYPPAQPTMDGDIRVMICASVQ